jgi:hypothetical protein
MTIRRTRWHRALAFLAYLSLFGAGLAALINPPASMRAESAHLVVVLWGSLMAGGSLGGAYSSVTGNILPEVVGLPAMIGAVLVFVGVLAIRLPLAAPGNLGGSLVLMGVMLAFAFLLSLRAFEISGLIKAVESRRQ